MARGKKSVEKLTTVDTPPWVRLVDLYKGNETAQGRYDPRRDRNWTEHRAVTAEDFEAHLKGEIFIGCIPIREDGLVYWGGIDIDAHESDEDVPIAPVDEYIVNNKLPLVPCRTKRGGIHAYVFFKVPQPASRVRVMLARWATALGHGGSEIFPKQTSVGARKTASGFAASGNNMNMPYAGALTKEGTNRYAVRNGKKLSVDEFIDLAESMRLDDENIKAYALTEHPEAPPCVQRMLMRGVGVGRRNEALYQTVVYLRKMDPAGYESAAREMNDVMFSKPLPKQERDRTIASAGRDGYGYRCSEEPARSLCDREACLKRKFGISQDDSEKMGVLENLPTFSDLIKHMSEPVRWELSVDGVKIYNIETERLLDWRAVRNMIAERLTKIVPMIKGSEWERILQPLMAEARIVETPDDASIVGMTRERFREFAGRTNLRSAGEDIDERKALLRGMPCVVKIDGDRCVVFRAQDFQAYLKRNRSEDLKGVNLWFAMKNMGTFSTKMRAGESNINVWCMPIKLLAFDIIEAPKFKADL